MKKEGKGRPIHGYKLSKDFNEILEEIISRADQVYSLTAVCAKCGEDATFTQRIMNGRDNKF